MAGVGPKNIVKPIYRIAEDKWYSRLTASAKTNYREMGLVQLSICVYTGKTGNINIDM